MAKSVLLTGAAGFIGSSVAERFLSDSRFDQFSLIGLDNFDPYYPRSLKEKNISGLLSNSRFQFIEGFSGDEKLLEELFENHSIDGVIHLGARAGVGASLQEPEAYAYLNLTGSQGLFHTAGKRGVSQFLFASSSSVYGLDSETPFKENQACLMPMSPYAATKRAGELLAWNAHYLYQMPMTSLRFFTVYGPRQRPEMAIAKFCQKILRDETISVFGDGSMERDFTFIDDIVMGVLNSFFYRYSEPHFEIFNLGNNRTISVTSLISEIEKATGKKAKIERLEVSKAEMKITCADISKAQSAFAYKPQTKFDQGLKAYLDWLGSC